MPNPDLSQDRLRDKLKVYRRAVELLASSLEFDETLAHTISACLPALGDFGFFDVVVDDGVRRTARAHLDDEVDAILRPTEWIRQERPDMNLCALSTGQAAFHPDIDDGWYRAVAVDEGHLAILRRLAFRSMISVPMWYRGELVGALTLFMGRSGRRHTEDDLELAMELAMLAAPTVVNVRLLEKQRRAEAALRASEERLRIALDAGGIGIWDWNILRDEISWSDRVHALYGLPPGSFQGGIADFAALVHPEDLPDVQARIEQALAVGSGYTAEFRALLPGGRIRWLSTQAHLDRDAAGTPVRMVGATTDITKRMELLAAERAAKAEALAASRAKDEFLAILGHELRNPLAPIVTALQLMELRGERTTQYEQGVIRRQVDHLSRLVDDLLDIARISQGKVELRLERIDLAAVLDKAIEVVAPVLEKNGIRFDARLPEQPVYVLGDPVRLAQVLANLLGNAAKFTPPGGHVTAELTVADAGACLRVTDSGIGIPPDLLPHVFDMFVQGPQRIDREAGGLGLGLTIARTLVRMHGGSISAVSAGKDQGSLFEILLPIAASALHDDRSSVRREHDVAGARVLVVDDNVDAGETISELLRSEGCEVRYAPDGATALAIAADFVPGVAILDIGLPDMDGYELGRLLSAMPALARTRFVALSGYGARPGDEKRFEFSARLVKPVRSRDLLAALAPAREREAEAGPPSVPPPLAPAAGATP
ncbi:PAS domain-containing protein [Noviherbaspirillum sp. 17J57-3]|uniref:histidine kinase n=1 Tax=Noviherbaspirillum galbum TaxID=2709383 RepID=A0A6B3SU60_9BURK|nr:PAS domain-containing protein [Noviherbaspirillum galbum]